MRQDKPYLFNHKALAKVFAAKLLAAIEQQGLALPARLPEKWVLDCKCVGSGEKALVYLGRYLYRGVIQEKDKQQTTDCAAASGAQACREPRAGLGEAATNALLPMLWAVDADCAQAHVPGNTWARTRSDTDRGCDAVTGSSIAPSKLATLAWRVSLAQKSEREH